MTFDEFQDLLIEGKLQLVPGYSPVRYPPQRLSVARAYDVIEDKDTPPYWNIRLYDDLRAEYGPLDDRANSFIHDDEFKPKALAALLYLQDAARVMNVLKDLRGSVTNPRREGEKIFSLENILFLEVQDTA